jgi:hypothetical protein
LRRVIAPPASADFWPRGSACRNSAVKKPQEGLEKTKTKRERCLNRATIEADNPQVDHTQEDDMAKVNGKYLNDIADDLPEDLRLEYELVKDSYRQHKATQAMFEAKLRDHLGEPNLVCSYRFGQLSISVGEPKAVKAPVKPKLSLSDWLEQQH